MQRTSISGAALHDNDSFFKCYCHRKCLYSRTLKETAFVPTQKWQIEVENELCTEKHKDKLIFFYQNCSDQLWEKNCSSDREKLLNFETEGQEFAKKLRSLE